MLETLGAALALCVAAVLMVGLTWVVMRPVLKRSKYWYKGAAFFLFALWVELVVVHSMLTREADIHLSHGHDHWALEFWRSGFENLQSEDWQIWLAALVFAWWAWSGSPESKEIQEVEKEKE